MCILNLMKRRLLDFLALAAIAYLLVTRVPGWIEHWKLKDKAVPQMSLLDLAGKTVPFPPPGPSWVVVFWATWCGPCGVELDRLKDAVVENRLDPQRILAVSVGESRQVVDQVVQERSYPFQIFLDPTGDVADFFEIHATPTVVLIDSNHRIQWISSGLSPTLIWRAERHLSAPED